MSRKREGSAGAPVRWGILGTGSIARLFARDLMTLPDAHLVAVGSRSPEGAEAFGRDLTVPRRYGSYVGLVGDPHVDVVYVATPASEHRANVLLCLEAGKAVLCEKPLTVDAGEARDVVGAARRYGRFLMEAMWTRFLPAVRELRALVTAGVIGEVRYLTADVGSAADTQAKPRLLSPELGGGALLQRGVYVVSLASMLLGRPDRVESLADVGPSGVDEHAGVLFGYPGGRLALLLASIGIRTPREATVVGSTGHIRIHPPVICPSSLTVVRRPAVRDAPAIPGSGQRLRQRMVRYGKDTPLVRRLRERYWRLGDRIVHGTSTRVIRAPMVGEGLWYQAAEVMRCLRAGRTESDVMPLDESVAIMETMDAIRTRWGSLPTNAGS
jgi:predicted dehydrogenase